MERVPSQVGLSWIRSAGRLLPWDAVVLEAVGAVR